MLTTIEGVYENGQIVLKHKPKSTAKAKVMVIFEEEGTETTYAPAKRPFGIAQGAIQLSPDFDDPLEDLEDYM